MIGLSVGVLYTGQGTPDDWLPANRTRHCRRLVLRVEVLRTEYDTADDWSFGWRFYRQDKTAHDWSLLGWRCYRQDKTLPTTGP